METWPLLERMVNIYMLNDLCLQGKKTAFKRITIWVFVPRLFNNLVLKLQDVYKV